jgi:hypothetical protein
VARAFRAAPRLIRFRPEQLGYAYVMADDERTTEQKIASGRPEWTPFALLGSVIGVIAVLVAIVVALAALAYFLA